MARRNSMLVSRTLYNIGVVTLLTSVLWVAISIYIATGSQFKGEVDKVILEPINPVIDQELVKVLSGRVKVEVTTPVESSNSAVPEPSVTIVEGGTE